MDGILPEDGPDDRVADVDSVMLDVTHLSLAELELVDDSVLARSVRRLLASVDSSSVPVAGFNSRI